MTMPLVIASMLTATNEPRTFDGTSSAIYIGEINDAIPMATPLKVRPTINQLTVGARAVPIALTVKIIPARMISLRRPYRLLSAPPSVAARTAPIKTTLTTLSSMPFDSENCFVMNRMAPAMTPVSTEKKTANSRNRHGHVDKGFYLGFLLVNHWVRRAPLGHGDYPARGRCGPQSLRLPNDPPVSSGR
jgi:hypothetical protein